MNTSIRIEEGDRVLLAYYKLEYGLPTYSAAIRDAIEKATAKEEIHERRDT